MSSQEPDDSVGFDHATTSNEVAWCDATIRGKRLMLLKEWEVTIQTIIDDCHHEHKAVTRVLMEWRAKLEKEPTLLHPYQIDEIVREVRDRLRNTSQ